MTFSPVRERGAYCFFMHHCRCWRYELDAALGKRLSALEATVTAVMSKQACVGNALAKQAAELEGYEHPNYWRESYILLFSLDAWNEVIKVPKKCAKRIWNS